MIEASIIIPTYNRKNILKKCLEALFNQSYPKDKYEIILVDDGSTDKTNEMIASLCPPCRLNYIRNKKRLGQPKSRNRGIKAAKGNYIIFTDSDIIVVPEFIRQHLKFHKIYKDTIINGELIYISSLDEAGKKKKSIWDMSFSSFNTANVSVKKESLIKVGGFDEEFLPYGWEDKELGYRLKKMGLKNKKNPKALGYHFKKRGDISNLSLLKENERMSGINGALYLKKHPCFKIKLSVRGNPLFGLAFIGRWMEEDPQGKRFFLWAQKKNIKWFNAALIRLILYHYYLQGYYHKIKE